MNTVICFAAFVTMAPAACSDRHANRVNMAPDHEKTKSKEGTSARLGPTRLQHFEGEKSQIPYTEPAEDKNGYYYIVYLPGPERWSRTMPEWAQSRRTDIVMDIKRLTRDERIKWMDHP